MSTRTLYRGLQYDWIEIDDTEAVYSDDPEGVLEDIQQTEVDTWVRNNIWSGADMEKVLRSLEPVGSHWTTYQRVAREYAQAGSTQGKGYEMDTSAICIGIILEAEVDDADVLSPEEAAILLSDPSIPMYAHQEGEVPIRPGAPIHITGAEFIFTNWRHMVDLEGFENPFSVQVTAAKQAGRSGDGWVRCADGETRWGRFGAAGVLFFIEEDERRFFLQYRDPAVHFGGTWGIPGGALDEDESPEQGALREFAEEVGFVPASEIVKVHEARLAEDWAYWTVVARTTSRFDHVGSTWEADTGGWFTVAEMRDLPLHPGFAGSLGAVLP